MFTGSFKSAGMNPNAVAISRGIPPGFKGRRYTPLAPTRAMLQITDIEEFYAAYKAEILDKLDPATVYAELGDGAILLCWEDFNVCCHRRICAPWFEENLGIIVPEIGHDRNESLPWREQPQKPPSTRWRKSSTTNSGAQGQLFAA